VSRNLPAHVAYRRPAEVVPSQAVGRPARRLVADERPVLPPIYERIKMCFGPDLRVLLKVFGISLVIAFVAGVVVWAVTQ
jgi:hypothetical protein